MKRTLTPREWFDTYVNKEKLLKDIVNAIDEAVQNDSTDYDDENYLGLVHDIVGGANGRYIPFYALQYFNYEDIDIDNIEQYDIEYVQDELDSFTIDLEQIINREIASEIGARVEFNYWDSDGSYCMLVYINVDDYKRLNNEFEALNSGGGAGYDE